MAGGLGRWRHFQLTLGDGVATQLSDAMTDQNQQDPIFAKIWLQADDGNSNPVFIGGDNAVTTAIYGIRLPLPPSGVPLEPVTHLDGPIQLSDLWAIGTNGEKLNILARLQ